MDALLHLGMLISAIACAACTAFGHRRASVSEWLGQAVMLGAMLDMSLPGQWLPPLGWSALLVATGMWWGARARRGSVGGDGRAAAGCGPTERPHEPAFGVHRALTFVVAGGLIAFMAAPAGASSAVNANAHSHAASGSATTWLLVAVAALVAHAAWLVVRQLRIGRRQPGRVVESASAGVMLATMAAALI